MRDAAKKIIIAPSLLSADMRRLGDSVAMVEREGGYLHLDIMDGSFVPNLTFGPGIVKALRKDSRLFFDVHLMVREPVRFIEDFAEAGADSITVHVEACAHLHRTLVAIKASGKKAGVALNPATPLVAIEEVLDMADMVLLMCVNPGFGGQSFIESQLKKICSLRDMLDERGLNTDIGADGGINAQNVSRVIGCGANILVAGSAVFGDPNPKAALGRLLSGV